MEKYILISDECTEQEKTLYALKGIGLTRDQMMDELINFEIQSIMSNSSREEIGDYISDILCGKLESHYLFSDEKMEKEYNYLKEYQNKHPVTLTVQTVSFDDE